MCSPHRPVCSNAWPIGMSLLGGVACWRKCVCHCEDRLSGLIYAQTVPNTQTTSAAMNKDVELSALRHHVCLLAAMAHDNGLNLRKL